MKKTPKQKQAPLRDGKWRFPWKIRPKPYPATPRSKKNAMLRPIKRS